MMENGSVPVVHDFLTTEEKLVLTLVLSSLTVLGVVTNGLVVHVIISLGTYADVPANMFILSQAIAHLGNTVSMSFYIFHLYNWIWQILYALVSFTLFSSLGSLCLLTLNRVISITWPLKYPKKMTVFRTKILIAFIWTMALVITLLHLIGYLVYSDANFFNYGRYYMMLLMIIFISSNLYMFFKSKVQAKKIRISSGLLTGLQRNLRDDLKSAKTVAMVSITFLLAWLPVIILFFLYGSQKEQVQYQRYNAFFLPAVALNIISDPVIYYFRSPEFRLFYERWKRRRAIEPNISPTREISRNSFWAKEDEI